jgi:hypothetical protein
LDVAGGTALIIRQLIVPLTVAVVTLHAGQSFAQGASPPPWPSQDAAPSGPSPFPPVNGVAPAAPAAAPVPFPVHGAAPVNSAAYAPIAPPSQQAGAGPGADCMKEFVPLREDAEKKGNMIKIASEKHAPADEACKLIKNFGQAELKMIKYVETHAIKCGIPAQVPDQLKSGHKNTENMQTKVCAVAQQQLQKAPAGPSLSEVLGSSAELPDAKTAKKSGGNTFDTLNGNVLAR